MHWLAGFDVACDQWITMNQPCIDSQALMYRVINELPWTSHALIRRLWCIVWSMNYHEPAMHWFAGFDVSCDQWITMNQPCIDSQALMYRVINELPWTSHALIRRLWCIVWSMNYHEPAMHWFAGFDVSCDQWITMNQPCIDSQALMYRVINELPWTSHALIRRLWCIVWSMNYHEPAMHWFAGFDVSCDQWITMNQPCWLAAASRLRLSEMGPKWFVFETACYVFGGRIHRISKVNVNKVNSFYGIILILLASCSFWYTLIIIIIIDNVFICTT